MKKSFCGRIRFEGICMLVLIVLVGVIIYVQYTKEDTVTATVQSITTQQSVNGTNGDLLQALSQSLTSTIRY